MGTRKNSNHKKNKRRSTFRGVKPLGPDVLWKYPGKYVVYSEEEQRVIGVGETEKEAYDRARASGVGGLWHSAYAPRDDELIC